MQYPRVTSISFHNHIESIAQEKIAERVLCGEVIIVRQCLQGIGYFEHLQQIILEGIRQTAGEEKAKQLKNKGFEAFHEVINLEELPSVMGMSYQLVRALTPDLAKQLVKQVFQQQKAFYFEEESNVRFHIPYDIVRQRITEYSKFQWNGKVTPHGPHHDSWYQCPTNSVNVWMAISSVKIGNGLNIYPQVYGKLLPCTKDGKILGDQYFGSALNIELEPGDAIIFHGEHLHSSEINSTDTTRFVISLRMTLDKPQFIDDNSPYKNDYIYSDPNDGLKARLAQSLVKISRRFRNRINSAIRGKENKQNYVLSLDKVSGFDDTSSAFPQPISVKIIPGTSVDETKLFLDSKDLAIGQIKPVSQKLCVARIDEHRIIAFSRNCPHEGADLASGYLRDGCVVCPWHNLPISLENGASPCQSLPKLTVFKCSEQG
ncbi:Rieske 2Fe-2S domain-containing protein [Nostoc sphaeroides]|uniref:Ferredoxin subunit of nitrite reductase and ring-hydroxylating dioxygenase n=1 Tax=Nostoc sphaeroides CCNUC1 TaxID=2653204 RepID=A0A5P8WBZ0_9NOSO|nr:Rieske 2Fe-2S domain-containing protein [Nostoc sphaeroides]QFS50343.1 ferredoxin subunit of nitrite reductase and ring-hydroxylating dioxygenase [Nostoc sphaeroides CCNUC1]